ncbi:uro-adherence factor A [Anabrus simplex]|uniref:uro-adherence factor A n=1 Tax=Anabrus simplex TaxID=316456 RepID=UPI0035A31E87
MPQACCAAQCNHTGKNCKLKNFPSDPERALLWESNLNRADWERKPYHRLCKCHFDADQFEARREDGLRKLRPDAVPLLFPTHSITRKHSSDTYKEIIELSSKYRMIEEPEIKEETRQLAFPVSDWPLKHVPETEESTASKEDHRLFTDSEKSNSYTLLRALQLMPVHVDSPQIPGEEPLETQESKFKAQDMNTALIQDIIPVKNEDDLLIHDKTERESSGDYYCDQSVSKNCAFKKESLEVPEYCQKKKEYPEQKATHSKSMKIQSPDTYMAEQTPAINLKPISSQLEKLGSKEARHIKTSNVQCKKVLVSRSQFNLLVNSSTLCKSPFKASADNPSLLSSILSASKTKPVTKTGISTVCEQVSLAQKNVISTSSPEQLHKTTAENLSRTNNCKRYKRNVIHPLSQAVSKNNFLTNGGKSQLLLLDSSSDHVKEFLSHLNSVSERQSQSVAIDESNSKNKSVFTSDCNTISGDTSNIRSVTESDSQLEIISNTGLKEKSSKIVSGTSPLLNSVLRKRKSTSRKTSLVATCNTDHQNSSQQGLNHFDSSETESPSRSKLSRKCLVTERLPAVLPPQPKPQPDKNTTAIKEVKCRESNFTTSKNQKRQSKELQFAITDFEKPVSWLRQCISYLEQSDEPSKLSEIETVLTLSECSKDDIQEYLKHLAESENLLNSSSAKDAELLKPVSRSSQPADVPSDENSPRIKDAEHLRPVTDVKDNKLICFVPLEHIPGVKEEVESPGSEEIYSLKSEMKQMQDEIQKLKEELREKTEQVERMEKGLKVFNHDQLRLLFAGNVKKWSDETMVKATQIKTACGSSGYKLLVEQGWPIPCLSALDKRIQKSRQSASKTQS